MATIASELQRIQIAKSDIKDTLESKGVVVDANKSVSNYFLYADSLGDYKKELPTIDTTDPLTMVQIDENGGSVTLSYLGSNNGKVCQYKLNDGAWTNYTYRTAIPMAYGDKIQWRGDSTKFSNSEVWYRYFIGKGRFIMGGQINSLMNGQSPSYTYNYVYCFSKFPVVETYVQLDSSVPNYTYLRMYENCIILRKAQFTINAVGSYAYQYMFNSCCALEEALIDIRATTTKPYCYDHMFYDCVSLTVAPDELPSTTTTEGCYQSMFEKCRALKYPTDIAATSLDSACCKSMFAYCSELEETPLLCSTSYVSTAYDNMFQYCSKLKRVYTYKTPASATPTNWMQEVGDNIQSGEGILYCLGSNYYALNMPTNFKNKCTRVYVDNGFQARAFSITPKNGSCSVARRPVGEISSKTHNYFLFTPNAGGLVDARTSKWSTMSSSGSYNITVPSGKILWMYGNQNITQTDSKYYKISINATNCDYAELGGELFTMNNHWKNSCYQTLSDHEFSNFFNGQDFTKIRFSDRLLRYRNLATGCYSYMFKDCTGLTFGANQNLKLPATNIPSYAYHHMFHDSTITSLVDINGTTYAQGACEGMYWGCKSAGMTSIANFKIPKNTVLNNWCFAHMFQACFSLVTPMYEIPKAKTLNGVGWYEDMFRDCASMTKTPIIRKSSDTAFTNACNGMFYNCTSLSSIKVLQPLSSEVADMFTNVSSVGILETIPENLTTITVPEGWTKIEL